MADSGSLQLIVLLLVEIIGLGFATAIALRWYQSPNCPSWISSLIFVSWYLGFAGILLLPFDIANAKMSEDSSLYDSDRSTFVLLWMIIYWTTWVLAWIILPLAQEWFTAGDFTDYGRFKTAVSRVLFNSSIVIGIVALFFGYLLFTGEALENN